MGVVQFQKMAFNGTHVSQLRRTLKGKRNPLRSNVRKKSFPDRMKMQKNNGEQIANVPEKLQIGSDVHGTFP